MKFSHKLSLFVIALTGLLFTLGGSFLVYTVFQNHLAETVANHTSQHILEKYALETDMLTNQTAGLPLDAGYYSRYGEKKTGYVGTGGRWMALYTPEGEEAYSNLPPALPAGAASEALAAGDEGYVMRQNGNAQFLLLASTVGVGEGEGGGAALLLSCYDISAVYGQRQQNLYFFWRLCGGIVLLAAVSVFLFSALLTRPIGRLSEASRRIAGGHYRQRVQVDTHDEVGHLAENFNAMAAALEEKMDAMELALRQKDDFVSAFTHEVKTPMTTLVGYAKMLRLKDQPPDIRQQAATAIFREAKRLEALSQRLLELMGLAETAPQLACIPLANALALCRRSLPPDTNGIEVLFEAEEAFWVLAQADLLADLLRNLVLNAMAAKPRTGQVLVQAQKQAGQCTLRVVDSGCGMSEAELLRICEPFYMADKSRRYKEGASGLGLAICEKIALLHGGPLQFKSKPGQGTEVWFTLPLCSPEKKGGETE